MNQGGGGAGVGAPLPPLRFGRSAPPRRASPVVPPVGGRWGFALRGRRVPV